MQNTIQDYLKTIRQLIAKDELNTALAQLRNLLKNSPNLDEVLLQSARFQDIRKQIRQGIISNAEANLTQNQIRAGLLELLTEIENQTATTNNQPTAKALRTELQQSISIVHSKNVVTGNVSANRDVNIGDKTIHTESETSKRLRLFLFLFVPMLALVGAYFWYQYQLGKQPLHLKVLIENQTPNPQLSNPIGRLTLTYGGKSEPKPNIQKEAFFEKIPAAFREEIFRLTCEAAGFVKVDTSFKYVPVMTLPVRRNDDLATIKGFIYDTENHPIEGVKIALECCNARTDIEGAFTLRIPFEHQLEDQRLDLSKTDYIPKSTTTPVIKGELFREYLLRKQSE